jgi:hypothetical protein
MASPGRFSVAGLAALVGALGGCAGPSERPYFFATATADWPLSVAEPALLGYWVTVTVTKKIDGTGNCQTISAETRVTVNGGEVSFAADSGAGCAQAEVTLGPMFRGEPVSVVVEHESQAVGHATFSGLLPGTAAALIRPADGQLRAGDDLLVRPVPEAPAGHGSAYFFPLDQPDGKTGGIYGTSERLLDGIHVLAPPFLGRAWLVVRTTDHPGAEVSCAGFATCFGRAASVLGPFLVTGTP